MIIKDGVLNIKNIGSFKKIFKERIGRNLKREKVFLYLQETQYLSLHLETYR